VTYPSRQQALFEPPIDRPLPLWILFPLIFVGVYLSHLWFLRLPYYWDEAGYYIPAAYDFFRSGSLIPYSIPSNAHPPLPSLYLALWWKASGFTPAVTRTAMCVIAAVALLGVYRLCLELNGRAQVAAATTALTAIYPIWFAQSTLAHADLFAAAGTLWGLAFYFSRPPRDGRAPQPARSMGASIALFALAALAKETAIVTPAALAAAELLRALRATGADRRRHLVFGLLLLLPMLPLAAWFAYHRYRTGYTFGNPEFLRYNLTANLSLQRTFYALRSRVLHLAAHMNMFAPVLCAAGALLLPPLPEGARGATRPPISPAHLASLFAVLLANALFFSISGGALLTRYLLPLYPLVLFLCVSTFYRRVRYWWALIALAAAAFLMGLFINPPYSFAPEDNLTYVDMIRLQQQAIRQIVTRFPGRTVLTAWPATDELTKPELGYVSRPVRVVALRDFSLTQVQKAAASGANFSLCLAFSTQYAPAQTAFNRAALDESINRRLFGFHRDLDPGAIARILNGSVFWRASSNGEWSAILQLERPQIAHSEFPGMQRKRPARFRPLTPKFGAAGPGPRFRRPDPEPPA
jgi:hypothetical protein